MNLINKITSAKNFIIRDNSSGVKHSMPDSIFMVVGCYNSGTTLLNYMLGRHSEISALETEGVSLTSQFKTPEDLGWNRLWYKCRDQLEISQLPVKPDIVKVRREWGKCHDSKKKYVLEKSIIHGLNIDWFEENLYQPHFIWIVRNGYAVAEGIRRRTLSKKRKLFSSGEPYPIEWCAEQWVQSNSVIHEKLNNVAHMYFIKYEDLMANPLKEMSSLLQWLPVEEKVVDIPSSFIFHGESNDIKDNNDSSIENLDQDDIFRINLVAKNLMDEFGYTIIGESE